MNPDHPTGCTAPGPAEGRSASVTADELLVHALLVSLLTDSGTSREERVRSIMMLLAGTGSRTAHAPGRRRRRVRRMSGLLAMLAVLASCWQVWMRTESGAYALVRAAARAAAAPGDVRYEVRAMRPPSERLEETPFCIVDSRAPGFVLVRATMPSGRRVIVGRDTDGPWAIRLEGGVTREGARVAWPRWSGYGESALLADSIDRVLEGLGTRYRLERAAPETLERSPGELFEHVVGERSEADAPGASHVELWIDARTSVLARMELRWSDADLQVARDRWEARRGQHPAPACLLVFERVEAPGFPDGWFVPETHAGQP